MKSFGVQLESEAMLRDQVDQAMPFPLLAEEVPMFDRSGNAIMAPVVRFQELKDLVFHYLNQHQEAGSLTWHGALPKDECWVKVGGDHGGKLFKLSFQIANVLNPNSVHNTVPFLVFGAKNTAENLTTACKPYRDQLLSLQ